jgi:hypothetical protein
VRRELTTGLVRGGTSGLLVGLVALAWMRNVGVAASLVGGIACGIGAATVLGLGMKLTILASRIKSLGIVAPKRA